MSFVLSGCATLAKLERQGKVDAYCNYAENFLYGAQLVLPLFGAYQAVAQVSITTSLGLVSLIRKASDDYAAQAILKAQLTGELTKLQEYGQAAGIGSPSNPR